MQKAIKYFQKFTKLLLGMLPDKPVLLIYFFTMGSTLEQEELPTSSSLNVTVGSQGGSQGTQTVPFLGLSLALCHTHATE